MRREVVAALGTAAPQGQAAWREERTTHCREQEAEMPQREKREHERGGTSLQLYVRMHEGVAMISQYAVLALCSVPCPRGSLSVARPGCGRESV